MSPPFRHANGARLVSLSVALLLALIFATEPAGVHAWPGAPRGEGELLIGANEEAPASTAISATPLIWQFFQEHRKP